MYCTQLANLGASCPSSGSTAASTSALDTTLVGNEGSRPWPDNRPDPSFWILQHAPFGLHTHIAHPGLAPRPQVLPGANQPMPLTDAPRSGLPSNNRWRLTPLAGEDTYSTACQSQPCTQGKPPRKQILGTAALLMESSVLPEFSTTAPLPQFPSASWDNSPASGHSGPISEIM